MLRLLTLDDFTQLQNFLSNEYFAGNKDIVVDVGGDIVSTINQENYKSGTELSRNGSTNRERYFGEGLKVFRMIM